MRSKADLPNRPEPTVKAELIPTTPKSIHLGFADQGRVVAKLRLVTLRWHAASRHERQRDRCGGSGGAIAFVAKRKRGPTRVGAVHRRRGASATRLRPKTKHSCRSEGWTIAGVVERGSRSADAVPLGHGKEMVGGQTLRRRQCVRFERCGICKRGAPSPVRQLRYAVTAHAPDAKCGKSLVRSVAPSVGR